jgi:2-amino-4-hydroxy-6-hydroxymethyldihydropteridine diphosphokinase
MILIGLGANLESPRHGPPAATLEAALVALADAGMKIAARSRWWRSAPVPVSDQPWFVNGVARVETTLDPVRLLALLHEVEADFGRVRSVPNAPRVLDLDLLDHDGLVRGDGRLVLPHPRMHERAFVLLPLGDIAPDWRHPVSGLSLADLIAALPPGQECIADPQ